MRKVYAWLGAAALFMLVSRADAANDVLKPYVVLILDTSGSMNVATGSGPTSCGKKDSRVNHAVCAINNIVNSYGDMVFSLARFRETTSKTTGTDGSLVCDTNGDQEGNVSGTTPPAGGDVCNTQGANCGDCDPSTGTLKSCTTLGAQCTTGSSCQTVIAESGANCSNSTDDDNDGRVNDGCPIQLGGGVAESACTDILDNDSDGFINDGCPAAGRCQGGLFACQGYDPDVDPLNPAASRQSSTADQNFELLTALVDGNNIAAGEYTNGSCNTCSVGPDAAAMFEPEIWGVGKFTYTPLAGSLAGAKHYWMGYQTANNGQTFWAKTLDNVNLNPGFDPINRDPAAAVFLPANGLASCNRSPTTCVAYVPESVCTGNSVDDDGDGRVNDGCAAVGAGETDCADTDGGPADDDGDGTINDGCQAWCGAGTNCCCASQCRPYITILLTDGDETCTTFQDTLDATSQMLTTQPESDSMPIASITRSGTTVTLNTSSTGLENPFRIGEEILITGTTNFNGTFTITATPTAGRSLQYTSSGAETTETSVGAVRHTASFYQYRVVTKPIGFGITPGDAEIEAIAHAGGAVDLPGVNEGYYAADEADLELAVSSILADSVRSELCNSRDDDCDIRIDEDFPNKGMSCTNGQLGICLRTGTFGCRTDGTGLQCSAVTVTPGSEGTVCNQLDDDCDGRIDEGLPCQSCVPTAEICDDKDNDCDNVVNQVCRCGSTSTNAGALCDNVGTDCLGASGACVCTPITRSCGNGVCTGTETCTAPFTFTGCNAPPSSTEICDGKDNDCDGVCDGFQLDCSEQVSACTNANASCPAIDSLGHPTKKTIPQNICQPGVRTCPLDAACDNSNTFGACQGEVKPCGPDTPAGTAGCDTCNGLDDDCDNVIDENFIPADCSTNCGIGTTKCTAGVISCDSMAATNDPTCNNVDDDCDGKFDEDWKCPDLNNDSVCDPCSIDSMGNAVCMGVPKCITGNVVCQGTPVGVEVCNCLDDNCNNMIDENTCGTGGSQCVNCQCAFPCTAGEFPCPLGKKCEVTTQGNFCVNDPCFNVTCAPVNGNQQTCITNPAMKNEGMCVNVCDLINDADNTAPFTKCPTGQVCVGALGECRPDNCLTFPDRCAANESCVAGTCVSNPCQGVTCDAGKYCLSGSCVASCADVECPTGQRCRQGACETDPCGEQCPFGQACNDATGQCINDPCKVLQCQQGQWCNPNVGTCEDDPCVASNVKCPDPTDICRGGTCLDPDTLRPDAAGESHVTVGGGGGCSTTGGGSGLLLALGLLLVRRRRTVGGIL